MSGSSQGNRQPHAHLHNIAYSDQQKFAREGDQADRVALERIYGKSVWEALLHNPRVTVVEVARIAQKAGLSKHLIETIVANQGWLANNGVRRGLLANPRLGRDLMIKVLRAMPKHELRLVPKQSIYGSVVREAARRLVAGGG